MRFFKKIVLPILPIFLLSLFLCFRFPKTCPLCTSIRFHAPCILNLSTGEIVEITLYKPHPTKVAELDEIQDSSTFSYITGAGLRGYVDTSSSIAEFCIPADQEPMDRAKFCRDCRSLLSDYRYRSYLLADLYTANSPVFYYIADGADYTMRCYTITISQNPDFSFDVCILGMLS